MQVSVSVKRKKICIGKIYDIGIFTNIIIDILNLMESVPLKVLMLNFQMMNNKTTRQIQK